MHNLHDDETSVGWYTSILSLCGINVAPVLILYEIVSQVLINVVVNDQLQ